MSEVNELDVLDFIKRKGPVTTAEITERLGLEPDDAIISTGLPLEELSSQTRVSRHLAFP